MNIDREQNEDKSCKISECYTENCTTTKFRYGHVMTLIFVGMSI